MFQRDVVKKIKAHRPSRRLPGVSCSDDVVTNIFSLGSILPGLGCTDDVLTTVLQFR
jgi:hypothetical protein